LANSSLDLDRLGMFGGPGAGVPGEAVMEALTGVLG
jgi:hypothetical protein